MNQHFLPCGLFHYNIMIWTVLMKNVDYLTFVGSMIPASIMLTYDPTIASYPQLTSSASSTLFTTTDASEKEIYEG